MRNKKAIQKIQKSVEKCEEATFCLKLQVHQLELDIPSLKSCEVCGCLITEKLAIKGKPEIRTRSVNYPIPSWYPYTHEEDYIYYPYFCRVHDPKKSDNG